jgi:hypothetical protein
MKRPAPASGILGLSVESKRYAPPDCAGHSGIQAAW